MTCPPIDALCRTLLKEFERDPRGTRVAQHLGEYARACDDWRDWALFGDAHYTRNLVHRCGRYELLLLAWAEGQESPIHDHAGQHCWMAVLDGDVEEIHYKDGGPGRPLVASPARRFQRGQVAYIADEIALHLVRPVAGGHAVSLHLYSDPIDTCRVYDPATGAGRRLDVGYHSVRGELCAGKAASAVRAEYVS